MSATQTPFSSRNRGAHSRIDEDFPKSGRIGLVHLLHDPVRKRYVEGWVGLARELRRIARVEPTNYDSESVTDLLQAQKDSEETLNQLSWERVYDFCERLHNHLAQEVRDYSGYGDQYNTVTSIADVQAFVASELQRLFLEEGLGFEFRDGAVERRGRRHTVERVSRTQVVLGDPRLVRARRHYDKALQFYRDPVKPDYENAVKEAVCAVEAAGKVLFPEAKAATLGDLTKWLSGNNAGKLPKALGHTFDGLYGFRSGGEGVGHGGASGGVATSKVAEYVLAVAASQMIFLVDLAQAREQKIAF
jgi:hypothetical protein